MLTALCPDAVHEPWRTLGLPRVWAVQRSGIRQGEGHSDSAGGRAAAPSLPSPGRPRF